MVKTLGSVNLLQPQLSIKYIGLLIIVVVVLLIVWAIANWGFNMLKSASKPLTAKAEEPTI